MKNNKDNEYLKKVEREMILSLAFIAEHSAVNIPIFERDTHFQEDGLSTDERMRKYAAVQVIGNKIGIKLRKMAEKL